MTLAGYKVVRTDNTWVIEQWDSDQLRERETPFSSVWADATLAQMVADVANALDAATLKKYIEVVENL